jgi:acetate kinase
MKILVINSGSSSVKFGLFEQDGALREIAGGQLEKIGEPSSRLSYQCQAASGETQAFAQELAAADHRQAFAALFKVFAALPALAGGAPDAIGHRVVHGGERFSGPARLSPEAVEQIRALIPLAPLHNPANVLGIEICADAFPHTPQIAVFDTAFHQTLPPHAYRYAVPETWYTEQGIRRYGFHGSSHQYLARRAAEHLGRPAGTLKLISLHLGNGASAAAIQHGQSIDTSMGFTPLEGLVMGTRSGDLDPMAALQAAERAGLEATRAALSHQSGLKGLCGGNDLREILAREAAGDGKAKLAVELYCYRIRKYIGAYFAILGGIDGLIFSGGVGENSAAIRARVCHGLECLGIVLSPTANEARTADVNEIQAEGQNLKILVIRTDEELEIARQTAERAQASA